ncbi:MAG: polysaccharide deacetylase family protein [Acidobacteriota bacterium]|jgi:peptidoglycan/xylan/chitin deacetylase (PgdA/CDA1 family)
MQIPVFCYHNAIVPGLERDLAFLADNGYRTLLASELVDVLTGAAPPLDNAVALTFDDGLLSLISVGLPLLERYDARATVFAITGLVPEGRTLPEGAGDEYRLMGWDDLRALSDSGRVEIGSHGHRHNPVHVPEGARSGGGADDRGRSPVTANVGPPSTRAAVVNVAEYARLYDVPLPYTSACDAETIRAADGTPTHASLPLFAAETLLLDGRPTSAREATLVDLHASRAALGDRLGIERAHLCLPYGAGNEAIPELAHEAGFESIFWTRRADREANHPGDDPFRIVRRKHDFVRRLPGRGRRSLVDLYVAKVRRRLTGDPWE